jgi:hypothetical protein
MNLLISVCFGAGVAAWVYSKMSPRLGYGNTKNIALVTGVVFLIASIVFYTILRFVLGL